MSYVTPTDLQQVSPDFKPWPLADRVRAALHLPAEIPAWARAAAATITMNEQPGKIPNGNCCGLMCQGRTMPWGWRVLQWRSVRPVGYAAIREGQTGLVAPFLAFAQPEDSLRFLVDRCVSRGIFDAVTYADKWVAVDSLRERSILGYNRAADKVLAEIMRQASMGGVA